MLIVNCAGIAPERVANFAELPEGLPSKILRVNLMSAVKVIHFSWCKQNMYYHWNYLDDWINFAWNDKAWSRNCRHSFIHNGKIYSVQFLLQYKNIYLIIIGFGYIIILFLDGHPFTKSFETLTCFQNAYILSNRFSRSFDILFSQVNQMSVCNKKFYGKRRFSHLTLKTL